MVVRRGQGQRSRRAQLQHRLVRSQPPSGGWLAQYEHLLEGIVGRSGPAGPDLAYGERRLDRDLPHNPYQAADAAGLPAVGEERVNNVLAAPRNELEQGHCDCLRAVLGRDQVGVHDNFFDLGGYSLLAVQVLLRLRR